MGHDQCPLTAELVYSGRVGGSDHTQSGGGSNPQCLPMDPNFLSSVGGKLSIKQVLIITDTFRDDLCHVQCAMLLNILQCMCSFQRSTLALLDRLENTMDISWQNNLLPIVHCLLVLKLHLDQVD